MSWHSRWEFERGCWGGVSLLFQVWTLPEIPPPPQAILHCETSQAQSVTTWQLPPRLPIWWSVHHWKICHPFASGAEGSSFNKSTRSECRPTLNTNLVSCVLFGLMHCFYSWCRASVIFCVSTDCCALAPERMFPHSYFVFFPFFPLYHARLHHRFKATQLGNLWLSSLQQNIMPCNCIFQ